MGNLGKNVVSRRQQLKGRLEKAALDKCRDNFTLRDCAQFVLRFAQSEPSFFGLAAPPRFHIPLSCGTPLGNISPTMETERGNVVQGGIATCHNVWLCPVCAAKIQARRQAEIAQGIEWARRKGYVVQMVTLTARHDLSDRLADIRKAFGLAYRRMTQGSKWRAARRRAGFVGSIRAVEMTHGARHGWHYHFHIIYISRCGLDLAAMESSWLSAISKAGFYDPADAVAADAAKRYAFDARDVVGADVAQYLMKALSEHYLTKAAFSTLENAKADCDSAAAEVAKSNTKLGRRRNRTPYQILRDAFTTDVDAHFLRDVRLFGEYATATKGSHQLDWSAGLKALVGIVEKTDEELAEEQEQDARILWGLLPDHWNALRRGGLIRDYFTQVAATRDFGLANAFFRVLFPDLPPLIPKEEAAAMWREDCENRKRVLSKLRNNDPPSLTWEEKRSIADARLSVQERHHRREMERIRKEANELFDRLNAKAASARPRPRPRRATRAKV